jgi:hypothetical protein
MSSRGDPAQGREGTANQKETAVAGAPPRRSLFLRFLSGLGLASLCYILGAAVVFFDLPSSTFLRRAFVGAVAWYESGPAPPPPGELPPLPVVGRIDKPAKTCDGFTLCMYGEGSRALLLNMHGEVVHEWHVPFSQLWTDPPHLKGPIDDATVYFNDGYLYPNGDLVVVVEGPVTASNPSNGYGLVKLDKDSRVLWKYAENCHHDVDVGADGTIYAIVNEVVQTVPPGLEYIPTPCTVDAVDVISPEGERLKRIPVLEAFYDSPYSPLLGVLEPAWTLGGVTPPEGMSPFRDDRLRRDVLHTNAVKVLNPSLAPKFPLFKAGQILISPRQLDALAVLDPDSGKVVWAARGPWSGQHDPLFLPNGRLLLFDNVGSPGGSRVLEYDPVTQAFSWSYPGEGGKPFFSRIRGMSQRLPNGNTLIVNSIGGEVFEVTPDREIVWSCSTAPLTLNRARRYTPDQLPFLKGGPRARP